MMSMLGSEVEAPADGESDAIRRERRGRPCRRSYFPPARRDTGVGGECAGRRRVSSGDGDEVLLR